MAALRMLNLALAFVLELCAVAALAVWGWHVGTSTPLRVVLAVAAVGVWGTVWALCFSPRARAGLPSAVKQWGQLAMFALAVVALGATGRWTLAAIFGAVVLVNRLLIAVWDQESTQAAMMRRDH